MEAVYLPRSELSLAQGTGRRHMPRDIEVLHESKANDSRVLWDFKAGSRWAFAGVVSGFDGGA